MEFLYKTGFICFLLGTLFTAFFVSFFFFQFFSLRSDKKSEDESLVENENLKVTVLFAIFGVLLMGVGAYIIQTAYPWVTENPEAFGMHNIHKN